MRAARRRLSLGTISMRMFSRSARTASFRPTDIGARMAERAFVARILGDDGAMLPPASRQESVKARRLRAMPSFFAPAHSNPR